MWRRPRARDIQDTDLVSRIAKPEHTVYKQLTDIQLLMVRCMAEVPSGSFLNETDSVVDHDKGCRC